jgi:hypothetical protein
MRHPQDECKRKGTARNAVADRVVCGWLAELFQQERKALMADAMLGQRGLQQPGGDVIPVVHFVALIVDVRRRSKHMTSFYKHYRGYRDRYV